MFELLFGAFWLLITGVVTSGFVFSGAIVESGMPIVFFVAFFGIFWAVGISMLVIGIKKVSKNLATAALGTETFGIVVDIRETNCYVNGCPQLQADVIMVTSEGRINRYSEVIGFDWNKYQIGDYLRIKHYKNDINILSGAHYSEVPTNISNVLSEFSPQEPEISNEAWNREDTYTWYTPKTSMDETSQNQTRKQNTIIINGVEYIRKN